MRRGIHPTGPSTESRTRNRHHLHGLSDSGTLSQITPAAEGDSRWQPQIVFKVFSRRMSNRFR